MSTLITQGIVAECRVRVSENRSGLRGGKKVKKKSLILQQAFSPRQRLPFQNQQYAGFIHISLSVSAEEISESK
jgi:hypothetical protein